MNNKNKFKVFILFLVLILLTARIGYNDGFRYNSTKSFPLGIYKLDKINKSIYRGKMIMFCPPNTPYFEKASGYGYIHDGVCASGYAPLIKKIAAIPGDTIDIVKNVYINGIKQPKSKVFLFDPYGHNLFSSTPKHFILGKDEIFVLSDYNELSFDSRYFGPININLVQGELRKIYTW